MMPTLMPAASLLPAIATPALTFHAAARSRQRGIRSETIDLIFEHADRERFVGSGLLHIFVSRTRVRKLLDEGYSPTTCNQLESTSLLLDPDTNAVVTALRGGADARGIKRYRRGQYSWTNSWTNSKTTH